jgi:hypothetical protein
MIEPSYTYDESAMMASIEAYKAERREADKKVLAEIDNHLRAIRSTLPPVPKNFKREVKRVRAMRPQGWCNVPTPVVRHAISGTSSLPRSARVCCVLVCEEWQMTIEQLTSVCAKRPLVRARHVAMFLMIRVAGMSLAKAGRCLGGLEHTTVLWGVRKIERLRLEDVGLNRQIQRLEILVKKQLQTGSAN